MVLKRCVHAQIHLFEKQSSDQLYLILMYLTQISGRQSCANICDMTDRTMSDCDGMASEKAESNSNYVSFINEHVHMVKFYWF